ncbi:MAG: cytochrome C [Deltaproteobacteria bacterium]|nr:cytochrome C [Deltaproteobacteria bacterium]
MKTPPLTRHRRPRLWLLWLLWLWAGLLGALRPGAAPAAPGPHDALYAESRFPSASQCAACHPLIYEEWRASAHAYASISPVFHRFEQTINDLSNGTIGTFCMRCHSTVATTLGEPREAPLWERNPVSLEGITCVTCHRVSEEYYKVNGERRVDPGPIEAPVYGPFEGDHLREVVAAGATGGRKVHLKAIKFEQLSASEACVSCHQVAVAGIKLEVVWDQYQASPAKAQGVTCQDCHMAQEAGDHTSGYAQAPGAVIRGVPTPVRRHSNHSFLGPGYPVVHPGLFPHNPEARSYSVEAWLKFNDREGWGSPEFEARLARGEVSAAFPPEWARANDRRSAHDVVTQNKQVLKARMAQRVKMMEHSMRLEGPFFEGSPRAGEALAVRYSLTNLNIGHNLPSGSLGAQPELWLNVALVNPSGETVWESGYVDSQGDMCDLHSQDVLEGRLPHDDQLVNLQTKFLVTNLKGTDREAYLPINVDLDQLPMIRPAPVPSTVMNHPPFARMEGRSLPPLRTRDAEYELPAEALRAPGRYTLSARLRSRAEPIYFMRFIGATEEMIRGMNEGIVDLHPYAVSFEVK